MKILVCTDFSSAAAAGEREASRRFPDATLIIFHAVDERLLRMVGERTGQDRDRLREEMTNYADVRVDEIVNSLRSQGRRALAEITTGEPAARALQAAQQHGVDLVVVGVDTGARVGTFRIRLVRESPVPVLIIPA
jgi:nucleotide-binding universal stress UspA family protein